MRRLQPLLLLDDAQASEQGSRSQRNVKRGLSVDDEIDDPLQPLNSINSLQITTLMIRIRSLRPQCSRRRQRMRISSLHHLVENGGS